MRDLKDASFLFQHSPFSIKRFWENPYRFFVQFFTWSKFEHLVFIIDGKVLHADLDNGVIFIPLDEYLAKFAVDPVRIYLDEPKKEFNQSDKLKLIEYCKIKNGEKYDLIGAELAWLDEASWIRSIFEKRDPQGEWCSGVAIGALVYIGIFPKQKDRLTPAEAFKKLKKSNLFINRGRIR
tara:strand:- start:40 stop:579 length:540 start_codon:yes stop_codon:yes gene_type:complete